MPSPPRWQAPGSMSRPVGRPACMWRWTRSRRWAGSWQVVRPIVARAAEAGTPVHVFGEMVALLWDFGQVNAAIEVEAMWNELAAQYSFSLLCAYPADSVRGDQHQDALAEVCRVHASVAGDVPGRA